ncbi:MAG: hypothetical protein A2W90_00095 [Bacteroidetes bacterium GWF2_42_66]|nr:MAG: hypothetical protein A2W92_09275 [Bacteroidetes bacterium GWA2_42_15]OFX97893.1 MAG: hypothetical protein A2W89_07490 [Bacteroidetes bacterium GWE2_42_39]OFY44130.1 MAG: hypothetical protein A2W90_00095 [Bacteroidetes bacterium GWF2_42_66]HAZ03403.1 hypothetical protein [Marinilabiliales bacterium]HBL74626.1 hypothetical protein [Prolixibacteraceae bacterium]
MAKIILIIITLANTLTGIASNQQNDIPIKGWIILSDSYKEALVTISKARDYNINHLELSHKLIMNLREVREPEKRRMINKLVKKAHSAGITEVLLWDHALYDLDYYPDKFKTGPGGTIDLDNPVFWEWVKNDYREMLNLVPDIQGIVLTFIETGARAEDQYSEKLKNNQEKLAAVVNAVASVVIGERGLNMYARTFSYTHKEYDNIVGAVKLFAYPEIRLMMKETPHDFFLTHPNDFFAGTINRPTIIEFDCGAEFNGQGIVANTWPEYMLGRWSDFLHRDHITGYAARTDRYGNTTIIGRPSEINLYALNRYLDDRNITAENIYDEFITSKYNANALPFVKAAFKNAFDIATSVFYTLGTSTANHSSLNYDSYASHWARHVSGKWFDPPVVFVKHGVNHEFHYWKDVVNRLAPVWAKAGGTQWDEVPWVLENGWITPGEMMNEDYLNYIKTEKEYGITLTRESLSMVEKAKPFLTQAQYQDLHHYFNRTLLTAQLHKATATAYFGYRIYARGKNFRTETLRKNMNESLSEIKKVANLIKEYPEKPASGNWDWSADAERALKYYDWITHGTWPAKTNGFETGLDEIIYENMVTEVK